MNTIHRIFMQNMVNIKS